MSKFEDFREKYKTFLYKGYEINETPEELGIVYHFEVPGLGSFAPTWTFPKQPGDTRVYRENGTVHNIVFSLGMVELVSYWKIVCPPQVIVEAGTLNSEQRAWWKKLYYHGLGEFFYTNGIDLTDEHFFDDFMSISCAPISRKSGKTVSSSSESGIQGNSRSSATVSVNNAASVSKTYPINRSETTSRISSAVASKTTSGISSGVASKPTPEISSGVASKPTPEISSDVASEKTSVPADTDSVSFASLTGSITVTKQNPAMFSESPLTGNTRILIPVGGGKDSAVTIELLKKTGRMLGCYIINPRGATINTVKTAGFSAEQVITPKRTLDPFMLECNRNGCLNGHTPYSSIVSFSATLAAYMHGYSYIALSNESSANESTVPGSTVNHQYSKSFEYEADFHTYEAKYVRSNTYYFSLLRPLSEFQIGKYFSKCAQYHPVFRSCNVGSKDDVWCGHCPKCLFVTCILSPFLSRAEITEIFGTYMLDDRAMQTTLWQLVGRVDVKPFECVGSRDEANTALVLTIQNMEQAGETLPVLLAEYKKTNLYPEYVRRGDLFSSYFNETNLVPADLIDIVKENCVG